MTGVEGTRPRVLIIGYHFPPRGGVAAQRLVKFVRYLPGYGWHPIVLTPGGGEGPKLDPSLLSQVAGADVLRTHMAGIDRMHEWMRRRRSRSGMGSNLRPPSEDSGRGIRARLRWFLFPDDKVGWLPWAVAAGRRLATADGVQVILSTSPPATSHLIAWVLHRATGIPWVADFRDPWASHTSLYFPSRVHRRAARWLERAFVRSAGAVICTTHTVAEDFARTHADVPPDHFVVIPNGFDPDDFRPLVRRPRPRTTVVYAGTFPSFVPGPRRNPVTTLDALAELFAEHPEIRGRLALEFLGPGEEHLRALIRARDLEDAVTVRGFVSHQEALQAMVDADALLLIGGISEVVSIGGKTFEYMAARRPIIAVMPDGENARLCREIGVVALAASDDRAGIAAALWQVARAPRGSLPVPAAAAVSRYARQQLTGQLADVLNRVRRQASSDLDTGIPKSAAT